MSKKRIYTKRNPQYWGSLKGKTSAIATVPAPQPDFEPFFGGEPYYTATAASVYARNPTMQRNRSSRSNQNAITPIPNPFANIDQLALPFDYEKDGTSSAREPILLCQKAYFHVPIFRNTIDLMAEMSDSKIVVTGGTKASRNFVKKWLAAARIDKLQTQFFREWYRSGNVFMYRAFASFSSEEIEAMKISYAKNIDLIPSDAGFPLNSLPMKYIVLNPADMVGINAVGSAIEYKKALTNFDVAQMGGNSSEEEKRALKKLKEQNKIGDLQKEVYVSLDPDKLVYSFYKKQDYEPFGVPFGFPVLKDINWKMELKKIDQSVSRSAENIILLITMGAEPDKGGINPKHLEAMKNLFSSEAVGRVLVADYTTKAQFIIPDLSKILTSDRYKIVNEDIKEGLQNILFDDSKYSNSEIKVKIFFEKLGEGRQSFLSDFLQPEIKKVCQSIGFRDYPKVRLGSGNPISEKAMQTAAMRLTEMGILTAKQGVSGITNRELPDEEEIGEGQKEYKKQREEGEFVPLIGGQPLYQVEEGGADNTPIAIPPKTKGRPAKNSLAANDLISAKGIGEVAKKATAFNIFAQDWMKKSKKLKSLSGDQERVVMDICDSIMGSNDIKDWEKTFKDCCSGSVSFSSLNPKSEVLDISAEFDLPLKEASFVYHSKKLKK